MAIGTQRKEGVSTIFVLTRTPNGGIVLRASKVIHVSMDPNSILITTNKYFQKSTTVVDPCMI